MLHGEPIGHAAPGRPEVLRPERNGRSCIAKQAEPNHRALIREEAALRLLGPEFAPELIEGSAAAGYLIMEDLGAPGSTHKIFRLGAAVSALPPRAEARRLRVWLEDRDGWYGLVHGDATAANCFILPDRVVWFDFETADFRRTALDAAFPGIRYLHSVWARNLPADWRRAATAAYRDAFIEPDRFDEEFQAASAVWLAGILMFRTRVVEQDVRWGQATLRQRIVAACEQFVRLQADRWPAWTDMAAAISAECRAKWSDCELLPY